MKRSLWKLLAALLALTLVAAACGNDDDGDALGTIEIVDMWEGDFADLVAGTEADVTTKLQQFEDIDAVWINFSVASIGAAQAIGALYEGDDPDRPQLLTFYANPTTVNDIRTGRVDAAVDEKLEWQSWAQVDAVAELLAFGTNPSQERAPDYDGRNFSVRQVVTIDTVNAMPADSTEVPAPDPPGDYEEYFRNKWCGQFSNAAGCTSSTGSTALPDITIGYLQWIYADEAGKRIEDAAKEAVDFIGWGYETCDAAGDPAQMPVCGNQLLDANIDVMLTDGIPEAFVTDVLERAEEEGVPVLSAGGEVEPRDFYVASFASDDTDLGVQLAEYLVDQFPGGARIIVQTVPTAWSDKRINGLNSVIDRRNAEIGADN